MINVCLRSSRESIALNFNQVREDASSVDENLMKCIAVLLRYMDQVLSSMRKHCLKEHNSLTLQLSYSEAEYGCKDRSEPEADDDMNTDDEDSAGEESVCIPILVNNRSLLSSIQLVFQSLCHPLLF